MMNSPSRDEDEDDPGSTIALKNVLLVMRPTSKLTMTGVLDPLPITWTTTNDPQEP